MAGWNGSGIFSRTHNWVDDLNNGINIRADRHDTNDIDFVNGINNCVTKDGQNSATADLPMGTYKHTNVGNGAARNQYLTVGQFQDNNTKYYTTTGSANAYVLTSIPAITSYVAGLSFWINPNFTNTGAATINVNGLGAKAITKEGTNVLESGDISTGRFYEIIYDGTQFQLQGFYAQNPSFTDITCSTLNATTSLKSPVLLDQNDNEALVVDSSISNTNYYALHSFGGSPLLEARGDSANVSVNFRMKGNSYYALLGTSTTSAELRISEQSVSGFNYVALKSPQTLAANFTMILPETDGAAGDYLKTDGSGNLAFDNKGLTQYSGAVINLDIPSGAQFNDLDLSSIVGANRALVFMKITTTGSCDVELKTRGDVGNLGSNGDLALASGTSSGRLAAGSVDYYLVMTDSSGFIEYKESNAGTTPDWTITILTYAIL